MKIEGLELAVRALCRADVPADVSPKMRVMISPWGRFKSNVDGKPHDTLVDEETLRILNLTFDKVYREKKVDLMFDYEHQSAGGDYARPDGLAPAAGWVRHDSAGFIGIPGDGIYVDVEWTPKAMEHIRNREYRYLSTDILIREGDQRPLHVQAVALVNQPQTAVKPILNSRNTNPFLEVQPMDKELLKALGLAENADTAACVNAVKALNDRAASSEIVKQICTTLKLDAGAKPEAIVQAINKLGEKPATDLSGYVPKAEFDAVATSLKTTNEKLASLESRTVDRDAAERIVSAKNSGKLTAAMLEKDASGKNYFEELARDGKAFDACMERMPVIAPTDGVVAAQNKSAGGGASSGGDRASVIAKAKAAFDSDATGTLKRITNKAAFVADELRTAGLEPKLTDEEKKLVA